MTQALYRKYRPRQWDHVIGQDHVVQTLKNAIKSDRVGHALLFAGPRGTGKTTVARLLAKAVNCLNADAGARPDDTCEYCKAVNDNRFLDLIEIDAASNTSVEDVRDLRDKINFTPAQGKYKVYIIDEVHMLSTAAFNALLKTLEEPPPHAIFVLATTEIHKIPATVLSRCQRHEFRRVAVDAIVANLKEICAAEKIQADEDALRLIARQSAGGMRDAQSLLDQLASSGSKLTLSVVQTVLGAATSETVLEVIASLADRQPGRGLESIHRALDSGTDARALARQIVEYLRGLLLIQLGNEKQVEAARDIRSEMNAHAKAFTSNQVMRMVKLFNAAATDSRAGWQPALSLELALADALEDPADANMVSSRASSQGSENRAKAVTPRAAEPKVLYQRGGPQPIVSAGEIIRVWKQLSASLPKSQANISALLNSVRMIDVQGATLILGWASDVLVSKIDKPDQIEVIQKLIKDHFGIDVSVRCTVTNAKGHIPSHVSQDGMVATAIQHGGEIVDMD